MMAFVSVFHDTIIHRRAGKSVLFAVKINIKIGGKGESQQQDHIFGQKEGHDKKEVGVIVNGAISDHKSARAY